LIHRWRDERLPKGPRFASHSLDADTGGGSGFQNWTIISCAIDLLSLTCYKVEFYWTSRPERQSMVLPRLANGSNAAKPQTTEFLDVEARFWDCSKTQVNQ
jgi:hypothetical protein